jgi:hypothetical protein
VPPSLSTLPSRAFRYRLTLLLWSAGRPLSVSELVDCLDRLEGTPAGRPGKVVSDALRWEMRRGRVRRVGRGLYSAGQIPRSTRWWMQDQIHHWEDSQRKPAGT